MNIISERHAVHSPSGDGTTIVVALTARERALFFGDLLDPIASTWQFLDDQDIAPNGWAERITQLKPTVLISGWSTPPLPERWLADAGCPLKHLCHVTGSVRRLVPRSFLARGGIATNWGESVSPQVAEHALLLALAALRNAAEWRSFIARPVTERRLEDLRTKTLFARRVGLHGFGSIVRSLVPLLTPFGVTLEAYSAGVPDELMARAGVRPCDSLKGLFARSEVLFECEALTPATEQSVSADVLAALPDDAVFVNIGRGGLVDDDALQREGASGRIRVALDVVRGEPLTLASPYVQMGHVVLSPHIAGPTLDRYRHCGAYALANLRSFLDGKMPPGSISLAAYDRAT